MLDPIPNDKPAQWHFDKFVEFTQFKEYAGEPSPHLRTVVHLSKDSSWEEKIWRVGCYAVPYSVLSAEVLWTHWPYEEVSDRGALKQWLEKHWGHFHIRTERRCVRSLDNFYRSLVGYHHWIRTYLKPFLDTCHEQGTPAFYDAIWEVMDQVPFFGRYIAIRAIEGLRRLGVANADLYDIRAIGGHSPIRALTLFYPERAEALLNEDDVVINQSGEDLAAYIQKKLPFASYYVCAAMLCEYRKAFEDSNEYCARTQDAELEHYQKYIPYWEELGYNSNILKARREIFDQRCLGEMSGWSGVRKELSKVLSSWGYNWSDTIYDYPRTRDFSRPVRHKSVSLFD
jgi:hypothetical protein